MAKRLWDKGESVNQLAHAFTVGNDPEIDRHIFPWDVVASAAHAKVLNECNILSAQETAQVLAELKKIYQEVEKNGVTIPPELEDAHTTLEMMLTERIGELGKKIHTGRSRNDQVLVATRLLLKSEVIETLKSLTGFAGALFVRADKERGALMPGYTHFQPAMPSSVDMWLQAFAEHLLDHLREGIRLVERLDNNPLGVASGFGIPLRLNREISTKALGFAWTQRNPIHVQNLRGREELAVVRWWSDIASTIEKMSFDLILFSSHEYGFFSLPHSFTTGSSIMPQKRNPDVLELLRASASKVRAAAAELDGVTAKLPSSYHRDFQFTKEPFIRAAQVTSQIVPIAQAVAEAFTVNHNRLKEVMYPDLFATYQVYRLVREGKSFREAYQEVAGNLDAVPRVEELIGDYQIIAEQLVAEHALGSEELALLNNRVKERAQQFSKVAESVFLA
jgi:argininosuccinate lyase